MEQVLGLILECPIEELKEVVEVSKEPMLNFPEQNIIMDCKHEEST